jgi:hypothetical protein
MIGLLIEISSGSIKGKLVIYLLSLGLEKKLSYNSDTYYIV